MDDADRHAIRPSLFAFCDACGTLYLNAVGKELVHTCTVPTGRMVTDIHGGLHSEVERSQTVELQIRMAKRVVKL